MLKQVKFSLTDIVHDSEAVSQRLNKICSAQTRYQIRGVCQVDETVFFMLLPAGVNEPVIPVVLTILADTSDAALEAEFTNRWAHGFDTIGTISLGEGDIMAVFADVREFENRG